MKYLFVLVAVFFLSAQSSFAFQIDTDSRKYGGIKNLESKAAELADIWSREKIAEAISLYDNLVDHSKTTENSKEQSWYLREAAKLKTILGEYEAAIILVEKSLKLEQNSNNIDGIAESFVLLSYLHSNWGLLHESEKNLKEVVKLLPYVNSEKVKANLHFYLGEIYFSKEDIQSFINHYSKALGIYQNLNDKKEIAKTYLALSYAYLAKDDVKTGLFFALSSLDSWKQFGQLRGITFSNIACGLSYFRLGESAKALTYFNEAKVNFATDLDKTERAIVTNNIGRVYESFGDCNTAIANYKEAEIIFEQENSLALSLGNLSMLGTSSFKCGLIDGAEIYLKNSVELAKKLNRNHDIVFNDLNLAEMYLEQKSYKKAETYYKNALELAVTNHYSLSKTRILAGLGKLYFRTNQIDKANDYYQKSIELSNQIRDQFTSAETKFQLAKLNQLENNPNEAIKNIMESLNLTETLYSDVANSNLKRSYFSHVYERFELYVKLLMQKHKQSPSEGFATKALQASEKSRSRSLLETLRLSEANFTKDANPQIVQKEKELLTLLNLKLSKLNDVLSSNAEKTEIDKLDEERRMLENELETIKAEIKQQSPIYSAIKNPPPFDVAEFQRNVLDEKTLLLEYSFGEKESYLWVVSKNEVSSVVLPSREVLEKRIDVLRNSIEERQKLSVDDPDVYLQKLGELESVFNSEAKLLSNDLLGQVADKLEWKRLIVVPDGKLALLPLSALPFPNSDEPMIAKNEIVYEPSASLLNILPNLQTRKQLPTKDLLVFADPVFSKIDSRLTAKTEKETESRVPNVAGLFDLNLRDFRILDADRNIPRLPASQNEADSISKTLGGNRTTIASGFDANRERVLNSDIGDYRMLHFATHGLIDMNRPEISSIVLSQLDEGGNKREGFLRLQDIYAMDLATDLVVLSACQSGIGKEIRGEGLMSLNNAFLQAGAKSVVSSAWKVDDNATAELMSKFYSNLIDKGFTTSEALQQAQIEMSKSTQFKSPVYWAAFTVQGEFRQPIKVSTNYFTYVLFGLFGIVGFWIIWRFRKTKAY